MIIIIINVIKLQMIQLLAVTPVTSLEREEIKSREMIVEQ